MSYDLQIFATERPDLPAAIDAVRSGRVRVEGDPAAGDAAWVSLARVTRGGEQHLCTIDGPLHAEDEDAPDEVAAVLLSCHWTVQISMPASLRPAESRIVERVARTLADGARGVVFDPQADAVVWPRNPARLRRVQRDDVGEAGFLRLEWLTARRLTGEDAHLMLALFRRGLPEAVPVRFGDYEPPQGRLDRDGDDAFAEMWDGDSLTFWKGTRPVDHGYVTLRRGWGSALPAEERDALRPVLGGRRASEVDGVALDFRGEVIGDPAWLAAIATLFRHVCAELRPFVAAGYCTPDRNGESVSLMGRYWLGIPRADLWLLYVGEEYLPFLPEQRPAATPLGDGVVLELAERPDEWRTIEQNRIAWPARVVRGGDHLETERAAELIPEIGA